MPEVYAERRKHPGWSFFWGGGEGGIVNDYKPLTISAKQVHPRCLQRSATTSEYVYL